MELSPGSGSAGPCLCPWGRNLHLCMSDVSLESCSSIPNSAQLHFCCRNLCLGLVLGQRCQQIHLLPPGWLCFVSLDGLSPLPPSPGVIQHRLSWAGHGRCSEQLGWMNPWGSWTNSERSALGSLIRQKTPLTDRLDRNAQLSLTIKVAFKTFSSSQVPLTGVPNPGTIQGL